jgi:hypothetical protein
MTGRLTAAATPVKFIQDNGEETQEYWISPLTDKDFDEIDEWLQARLLSIARKSLPPEATREEREELLSIATREAAKITWTMPAGRQSMSTIPGIAHIAWVSLRKRHPGITEDYLRELFFVDLENLKRADDAMGVVNSPMIKSAEEITNNEAKKAKRQRRRR